MVPKFGLSALGYTASYESLNRGEAGYVNAPVPEPSAIAVWSFLILICAGAGWYRRRGITA